MKRGPRIEDGPLLTAKRFGKQMFLSVDIPSSFLTIGQGQRLLLEAEKGIVTTLSGMENKTS
jgi:proteasome assembly chaperone 4